MASDGRPVRHLAVLGMLAVLTAFPSPARAESLKVQVNRAIDRGVARVRSSQQPDGHFAVPGLEDYPDGVTALAVYTLVKSGVGGDDPAVVKGVAFMNAQPLTKTYSTALRILALDALHDPKHRDGIHAGADRLVSTFLRTEQLWDYPGTHADLSTTQFATLGLWAAERNGYETPQAIWAALLERVPEHQAEYGAFTYGHGHAHTGGMATAGLTVLHLALDRVPTTSKSQATRARAKRAIRKGWEYLDERFVVHAVPESRFAFGRWFHHAYLYGIERIATLANRETIGGKDWYDEGARHLVTAQATDGSWGSRMDATCFSLLFLRRSTLTQSDRPVPEIAGEGVADDEIPPPVPPEAAVPYLKRWLVLGPFDDPDDTALNRPIIREASAAPKAKLYRAGRKWREIRSRHNFVDLLRLVPTRDATVVYAFTYLHAARDTEVVLWFGHDDAARMWVDGEMVHDHHFHEVPGPTGFHRRLQLTPGVHRVLFKVENRWGDHGLWFRVASPDGSVPEHVVASLSKTDPQTPENAAVHPDLFSLSDLLTLLPRDKELRLHFDNESDLLRVATTVQYENYPYWVASPDGRPNRSEPNPGGYGSMALHPPSTDTPARAYRKVRVPGGSSVYRVRVSSESGRGQGRSDALLRIGVFDGELHWEKERLVAGGASPSQDNWRTVEAPLDAFAGRDVLLVAEVVAAGQDRWYYECLFLDEMSVSVKR